ncbi:MAG: phosphonopyruvate decarboxylase [Defluviitaleaceae bacterium]|nr:phosphonopyruvate decarboxylase [Defluviitaleaceae bacterium]
MQVENFVSVLQDLGAGFYTGVPDSLLSPFTDYIMRTHGVSDCHIVAANEGAAVGLAAGHYLATGKPAVVYMQNSGIGNATNPICSLLHEKVYALPVIFVIGWRGEPNVHDEPQHVFQGAVTLSQLECMEIPYAVISEETTDLKQCAADFKEHIQSGKSVAFVVRKGALKSSEKNKYSSPNSLSREEILVEIIANTTKNDVFVCTTGKLSREVFEIRENNSMGHGQDFLTVGSMGHSLMLAYGIALAKPDKRVFCLDGDGAVLMHLGSLAVVGTSSVNNLVHIVINNGSHETVGGIPTVAGDMDLSQVAASLGYKNTFRVSTKSDLLAVLNKLDQLQGTVFVEVLSNLESRADLGRPTTSPIENKNELMKFLGAI